MTDLDQLDIMRRAITALGLGQCAPEELVAEARASSSRREQDRGTIADQRARIKELESALRDLGVNLSNDLQGEVRALTRLAAGDSAAAQHDLDCAVRERDRAIDDARSGVARIKELEGKIASNVADAAARDMRIAELRADLDAAHKQTAAAKERGEGYHNALHGIAGLAGIGSFGDPDAIRLVVKDMRTARDDARARVKELERDLADKGKSLTTAHAALKRICEVIGAPVPVCPDDAVEAVKTLLGTSEYAENRAETAEQALKDINLALLDMGAPRAYTLDDKSERPIPDPDRVRIVGDRLRAEWCEKERVNAEHAARGKEIADAHLALDDRGAPCFADGSPLSAAARIRSLPR